MGPYRIGVRWSRRTAIAEDFAAAVGACLGAGAAPPNLSVIVGTEGGLARAKHQLYVQGRWQSATSDHARLARSIARALTSLTVAPGPDRLAMHAVAVVAPDGRATLVDHALAHPLGAAVRRLERRGLRVVDQRPVIVDPERARLHLPATADELRIDRGRFDAAFPHRAGDDSLDALDAPIAGVVLATSDDPSSRAATVAQLARLVRPGGATLAAHEVQRLVPLVGVVPVVPCRHADVASTVDAVDTAFAP